MADAVNTSGKRKEAVARASVKSGSGKVRVNNVPIEIYTPELARFKMMEPLLLAGDKVAAVDINVNVQGGGFMGQAEAVRTSIAKGLVEFLQDSELEASFKQYDRSLLISDPRRKLPKKPQGRGARKKRQKSYR
ncbi:30S ribosomal protein S9 [Candidatus Methanomassiliicoccus intestinalis]|jgi:archaeal ribosomal protein S9P|uniref:Small ribosomal subunit protein uS9 n=1 Tax=Methanomassiliicoccus intestinalis (strain Issoire-Mx1) TaxID=1295009 RepID=R9T8H6_METII|nr:30S ribosomal protein S9 [Candidatus Methanomassiliicoccus intestinalis]AGN26959.1 30S ribosomal protein S9P [Candidatus Methanomassiliicoccus intestinalis Issoire-Mx1]TQS79129.1 MAG: 30S ribosomal protein S9 [Candidatus Methanomassiliicoccus intestinalis]